MVNKIKKSIQNSKNNNQFKKRQNERFKRKNKDKVVDQNKFVDKRKMKHRRE